MSHEAIALWTDSSSDPELIAGVRAGDAAAFGVLYERHVEAARKVAAQYTNTAADIDDVVSESFSRILRALQRGDGPDLAFRAYLFTIVRRTGMDVINRGARTRPRDDMGEYEAALGYGASSEEPTMDGFEQGLVADAFRSLPERWQAVLWYTEVEKKNPKEIAPLLGLSANGVAALAYRAREALRQAYLQQHLATSDQVDCLEANTQLGAYVRGGLSKRETSRVDIHVKSCERCAALVAELEDVNRGMRGIIAPLVMGVLGVGALEGGLPIGGALGAGAAGAATGSGATAGGAGASSTGAGAASGSATAASATSVSGVAAGAAGVGGLASAGAAGTAATAGTVAGFLGTAASLALPIAATVGVVALAATGASYLGLFGPDEGAGAAPSPTASASSEPAESPAGSASTPATAEPETSAEPDPTEGVVEPKVAVPAPVIEVGGNTGTSTGTTSTGSTGGSSSSDEDADDEPVVEETSAPDETADPEETSEPEDTSDPDETADPEDSPDPEEPTDPETPTLLASLSIKQAPLGFLSISSSSPSVPVTVENEGDGAADDVTADITLPAGLTFSTPAAGGVGFSALQADLLGDYLTFASEGTFTAGAWDCSLSDDRASASCALDGLESGATTTLDLGVDIVGSLASDATTSFRVSDGTDTHEYTVRTGLSSAASLLTPAYWSSGQVAATQVGASLLECRAGDSSCAHAAEFNGNSAKDSLNGSYYELVAADGIAGYDASNVTSLDIPAGATVEYAMLEWAASSSLHDSTFDSPTAEAKLLVPGATDLVDVTADGVDVSTDPEGRAVYQARLDVTDLVAAAGAGTYGLADVALASDYFDPASERDYYAGFTLTVVYSDDSLPDASVAVYDGTQWVVPGTVARLDVFAKDAADVAVGVVGWGGERGTLGEQLDIDGDTLAPLHWKNGSPSTADSGNAMDSTAFGFADANSFGVDAKPFRSKHIGEGLHTLTVRGSADSYLLGSVTFTAVEN